MNESNQIIELLNNENITFETTHLKIFFINLLIEQN